MTVSSPRKAPAKPSSAGAAGRSRRAAAQIPVRQDGLLHASVAQLAQALGASEASVRDWLRAGALELTSAGEPVTWLPDTATQGPQNLPGSLLRRCDRQPLHRDNVYRVRAGFKGSGDGPVRWDRAALRGRGRVHRPGDGGAGPVCRHRGRHRPEQRLLALGGFIGGSDVSRSTKRFTVGLPHVRRRHDQGVPEGGCRRRPCRARGGERPPARRGQLAGPAGLRAAAAGDGLAASEPRQQRGSPCLGRDGDIFYLDRIEMEYRAWREPSTTGSP